MEAMDFIVAGDHTCNIDGVGEQNGLYGVVFQ